MSKGSLARCILVAVALIVSAGTVQAASLFVANNGLDSGACGGGSSPCRSIGQAIANANNGDSIRVGPGRYSPDNEPIQGGCNCLILVDKALKIEAVEGAGGTVLDGGGSLEDVVVIDSDGVTFGLDHKGFTIVGGIESGVYSVGYHHVQIHSNRVIDIECGPGFVLSGTDVLATYNEAHCNAGDGFQVPGTTCSKEWGTETVCKDGVLPYFAAEQCTKGPAYGLSVKLLGNQAIGNHESGFNIETGVVELESNLAARNHFQGFVAAGNNLTFKFNAANANIDGFQSASGSSHKYDRNVSSGNSEYGFFLEGSGHNLEQNAVLGNGFVGIHVGGSGIVLTKNNIYGNDPSGNCGVNNSSGVALSAIKNYWGAASGPGADPADTTCGPNPTTTTPFLPGPTSVPYLTGSGGSP